MKILSLRLKNLNSLKGEWKKLALKLKLNKPTLPVAA